MNTHDLETLSREVTRLQARLVELEAGGRRRRRRWRRAGAALAAVALVATAASAANGNCPNGLPYCFAAGQPARAGELNWNLMQLKEWLETKVGATSTAQVSIASGATVWTGGGATPPAASGRSLFVHGNTAAYDAPIAEFRHSNLTQGVGIGWSSVFATGSNADQDLHLMGRGTGSVVANDDLRVAGTLTTRDGDAVTRMRATAPVTATVSLAVNVGVWTAEDVKDLAPAAGHLCFLQEDSRGMWATTLDDGTSLACSVYVDTGSGRWRLRASGSRGHHQETSISVACKAACLQWN